MTYQEKWNSEIKEATLDLTVTWLVILVLMMLDIKALHLLTITCVVVMIVIAHQTKNLACPQCRMTLYRAARKHAPPFSRHKVPDQCLECGFDFLQDIENDVDK
jgi:predicted RNA-binding Zn-ribbon protein involved in translation (DUF1610 family)